MLQHIQYILKATRGVYCLPVTGINTHQHIVQLPVGNRVLRWRDCYSGVIAPFSRKRDLLTDKAAIRTALIYFTAITKLTIFHQIGR